MMAARFVLALLVILSVQAFSEKPKHYKLIVVGAGPAGLMAANSATANGVSPKDILIIEKRSPGDVGLGNAYGSRHRVVVLDDPSADALYRLGISLPGAPFKMFIPILGDGSRRYVPYSGAFKVNIGAPYGGRQFSNIVTLSDLERSLLDSYQRQDGKVTFGTTGTLHFDSKDKGYLMINGEKVTADLIVWSAGSRDRIDVAGGEMARFVSTEVIADDATSHYLGFDIPLTRNDSDVRPGDEFAIQDSGVLAYAFVSDKYVLLNALIGVDLQKHPEQRQRFINILNRMAYKIGLNGVPDNPDGTYYTGNLTMANRTVLGTNVALIGDASSNNDPISGAGANKAIQNGKAVGRYFSDLNKKYEPSYAMSNLAHSTEQQTEYVFDQSLLFRDMAQFLYNKGGLADFTARLGGFTSRNGSGAIDIGKQVFAFAFSSIVGAQRQGEIFNSLASANGAPIGPRFEASRRRIIGTVHPDNFIDGELNTTVPKVACDDIVEGKKAKARSKRVH